MKNKKTNLIYFIVLIILTGMIGLFSYQEVYAKKNCNFSKDRTCDFSFGYFVIPGVGGYTCQNLHPIRVYEISIDNTGKNLYHGFCYYDPNKDGFYYEVAYSNCDNTGSLAFVDCGSNVVSQTQTESVLILPPTDKKLSKAMGCADWFYYNNASGTTTFSYYSLANYKFYQEEVKKQSKAIANGDEDADSIGARLGTTVDDDGSTLEKIKSCVGKGVANGRNCNDDGTPTDVQDLIKNCISKSAVNFENSLYDEYTGEILKYYNSENYAERWSIVCKLTKKCNAKTTDILTFFDNQNKSKVKSQETLIKESFPSNVQECVKNEVITNAADIQAAAAQTQAAIESGTEAGINDAKDQRDRDFKDNNQNYYEGEKLKIINPGTIGSGGDCSAVLSDETTQLFNTALRYMQYLGPVLVVVLSTIDFIKAAASGNPDDMKKAWNRLVKRLIAAILLFFVALITRLLLSFFDITVPENCLK